MKPFQIAMGAVQMAINEVVDGNEPITVIEAIKLRDKAIELAYVCQDRMGKPPCPKGTKAHKEGVKTI